MERLKLFEKLDKGKGRIVANEKQAKHPAALFHVFGSVETDRQTDSQTGRLTDRLTNRLIDRQAGTQTQIDRQADTLTEKMNIWFKKT